ncbi:hypothetical protein ACIPJS_31200 [Streptomyces sp. NPDC086783]|uniref:hypothetical protein n=1 Tax=Streptomyces sp. NPDC086783 TaxID=3365758 RepID=UPI00381CF2B8
MRIRPSRPFAVDTLIAVAMVAVTVLLGGESVRQGWPALDWTARPRRWWWRTSRGW